MNVPLRPSSDPAIAATEPSDSLDIRLIVTGRLSPTSVSLRHERAALASVLGRTGEARTAPATELGEDAR
jgi:hypothetical protein